MSFFEIEPMGARHYGGINVGGMPVGGMRYGQGGRGQRNIGMYGMGQKGVPISAEQKAKTAQTLAQKKMFISQYMADLAESDPANYDDRTAKLQATLAYEAMARAGKRQEASARPPRARKGEEGYMPIVRQPRTGFAMGLAAERGRISNKNFAKQGFKTAGEKAEKLAQVGQALSAIGLGMYHLGSGMPVGGMPVGGMPVGGAWYDDVLSGITTGVKTAAQLAPYLEMLA